MDELLRHGDVPFGGVGDGVKAPDSQKLKQKARAAAGKVKSCAMAVKGVVDRHPISPLLYLVILALAAGAFIFKSTYIKAYAVSVDGVEMAVVSDTGEVAEAVSLVESRVADVLGESYACPAEVTYTPIYSTEAELTGTESLEEYLYEAAHAVMDVYVLTVGGQEFGIAASQEELQAMLDQVAAPYMTENTVSYSFVEEVTITTREMASNTEFSDLDAILAQLTVNTIEEAVYVVEKGDTFVAIAKKLGMTMDELSALNPDVTPSKLWIDQELVIQQSVPFLSVQTVDNLTYEEVIESPIVYTETDTMYEGDTKVTEQGLDGLAMVNADVTYVNGYETGRTVITSTTLEEATTTYALMGTKEKPRTASKGYFITPVASYTITSKYGYRTLNGKREFHTGVDFAASYGTAIRAADGGTVTYAGWKGNYGKLVIITHDDGSQTYYAHNSSLLVSKGDKVYQGQTIAKMGSTGRSTGNHCHFEIRINGETVNPLNYL